MPNVEYFCHCHSLNDSAWLPQYLTRIIITPTPESAISHLIFAVECKHAKLVNKDVDQIDVTAVTESYCNETGESREYKSFVQAI